MSTSAAAKADEMDNISVKLKYIQYIEFTRDYTKSKHDYFTDAKKKTKNCTDILYCYQVFSSDS